MVIDTDHHLEIRAADIQYLRDYPECFIENNTEPSWFGSLLNVCLQII